MGSSSSTRAITLLAVDGVSSVQRHFITLVIDDNFIPERKANKTNANKPALEGNKFMTLGLHIRPVDYFVANYLIKEL